MQEKVEILKKSLEFIMTGTIGLFGGATYYLYQVSKGQQFKIAMFLINMVCAFFIGWLIGQFIPTTTAYRDGLIAIGGFSAFPILAFLETHGPKIITKIFK